MSELIIRPNSNSSVACSRENGASNWDCVLSDDGASTYVYAPLSTWKKDVYGFTNHGSESGTITALPSTPPILPKVELIMGFGM